MRLTRFRALGLFLSVGLLAAAFSLVVTRLAGTAGVEHRAARRPAKVLPERGERGGGNAEAAIGANETRSFLSNPEVEKYRNRAYPANEVAWAQSVDARQAWSAIPAGPSSGAWQLIGPSKATYPAVLNFLGDHAPYVTAGRVTAMAIAPSCTKQSCRMWVAAAGGGIWRTSKALSGSPGWEFVSGSFATNAIGALTLDPTDPSANTLYAGTGEPNASGDSEAGVGIYKSTDGGTTWTHLAAITSVPGYTGPAFDARSIARIAVDPDNANVLYVASALGIRGISSVEGGETIFPPAPTIWGVFKSTNGGASFTFLWNGGATASQCDTQVEDFGPPCSLVGATDFEIDPSNSSTLYAAAFAIGTWRSTDGGTTWTQIHGPLVAGDVVDRADFSTIRLPNGKTRMYIGDGGQGFAPARFFRTDDAAGAATFADLTTPQVLNYCTGQCWYDNVVFSPKGSPDIVYVGGSYDYGQNGNVSNARGWLLSTDAGATWSDVTKDGDPHHADAIHPDQHAIVVHPNDPFTFFTGSDGGVVRSDGQFADVSYKCAQRGLTGGALAYCQSLLWRVPDDLVSLNEGFSTLQYQSLSVSQQRPQNNLQGGTQDNGTFQYTGSNVVAYQEIYGDGGQSGFSAADDSLRFNTFTGQANDVNFRNGDPTKWCVATGPIITSPEAAFFYPPVTADPNPTNWGTIYQGSFSVWRTQDWGGPQSYLEANCPEFTTSAANPACGDFVRMGAAGLTDLGSPAYGATRQDSAVAAIERAPSNTGTLWAATGAGRVFITDNADAAASSVVWTRLDTFSSTDPARFITSIYVDPADPHHAWLSYDGYDANTPAQPGHVFEVTYTGGVATWVNISFNIGDMPITDLVRDDVTGDLYASSDFGVMRLASGSSTWTVAGSGLPAVEVPGLTIAPQARLLYAATHGRSAWVLHLP